MTDALITGFWASAGGIIGGPILMAIGLGVGLTAGIATFLVKYLRKGKRYKQGLEEFQVKIKEELTTFQNNT